MRQRFATVLLALAAGCATLPVVGTAPAPSTPAPGTSSASGARVADEVFTRTNDARRSSGLPALGRSASLTSAAQIQAEQMAAATTMSHELPGARYPTMQTRLDAVGYAYAAAGENIGEGYPNAGAAVNGWMGSSGHRANILSTSYTELGTGVATGRNGRTYWVQVFGRPR